MPGALLGKKITQKVNGQSTLCNKHGGRPVWTSTLHYFQVAAPANLFHLCHSCPVLSCPVRSGPVVSCPAMSCPVLSCPALPCPALPCPVLSCPALSCPVLSCPVLSCPVLSCLVLSCLVLSCLVLSCHWQGPLQGSTSMDAASITRDR